MNNLESMLRLRKELDPDAPSAVVVENHGAVTSPAGPDSWSAMFCSRHRLNAKAKRELDTFLASISSLKREYPNRTDISSHRDRIWVTWDDRYAWDTPETGGDEYVRVDLLDAALDKIESHEFMQKDSVSEAPPELKPCPFCGGAEKVKLQRDVIGDPESGDEYLTHWSVGCTACEVGTHWDDIQDRSVQRWNTRAATEFCVECKAPKPRMGPPPDRMATVDPLYPCPRCNAPNTVNVTTPPNVSIGCRKCGWEAVTVV